MFFEHGIEFVSRSERPEVWRAVFDSLQYQPVRYLSSYSDYQLKYRKGNGNSWSDYSCVLQKNDCPVGLWSFIHSVDFTPGYSDHERLLALPPIFISGVSSNVRKTISGECLRTAQCFAKKLGLKNWQSTSMTVDQLALDDWYLLSLSAGARSTVRHQLYIDLTLPFEQLKLHFRKSFRSFVNSADRFGTISILDSKGCSSTWEEFRLLHLKVSGRATRSLESWQKQFDMVRNSEAFLVYLRNVEGQMIGGGYFYCSRDEGVYAVGVYDRGHFDKPIGHIIQFAAIREMQRRGLSWYNIGERVFVADDPSPSSKEMSISLFKSGFASHIFPSFLLTHNVVI